MPILKMHSLLVLFVSLTIYSCVPKIYRIKKVNNIDFDIPPYAKLASEGLFNKEQNLEFKENSRFKYQYVRFRGLKRDNYFNFNESLKNAVYAFDNPLSAVTIEEQGGRKKPHPIGSNGFANYYRSVDFNTIDIEIDFDKLLHRGNSDSTNDAYETSVVKRYQSLKIDLMKEFEAFFPKSGAQVFSERIFELIPRPEKADLVGLGLINDLDNSCYSFLLVNPEKISLDVDNVSRSIVPIAQNNYYYTLLGQTNIPIFRDEYGYLKQSSFLNLKNQNIATNTFSQKEPGKHVLLSSTADIQLSRLLRTKTYLALYQYGFKSNNQLDKTPTGCNDENDIYGCTSNLLFENSISNLFNCVRTVEGSSGCKTCDTLLTASFGFRNLITPSITVYVNGVSFSTPLNKNVRKEKDAKLPFPDFQNIKISRKYNGSYVSLKYNNNSSTFYFLPGDKIEF